MFQRRMQDIDLERTPSTRMTPIAQSSRIFSSTICQVKLRCDASRCKATTDCPRGRLTARALRINRTGTETGRFFASAPMARGPSIEIRPPGQNANHMVGFPSDSC
jgi:hypothetical protein